MTPRHPLLRAAVAMPLAAFLLTTGAFAQQQKSSQPKAAPQPVQKAEPAAPGGDSALRLRLEQLEEQLVDMQVVVGTLESLARSGGGSAAPRSGGGSGGADPARVEQLESQVRTLSQQVEQLNAQVRNQGPGGNMVATAPPASAPLRPSAPGFSTTTRPAERDPISQIIGSNNVPAPMPGQGQGLGQGQSQGSGQAIPAPIPGQATLPTPSLPQATASDATSKQLYETAYGLLLAQDYGAAEGAFEEFLRRYSGDTLAGNAQYWLGETFFVRGNFRSGAASFLKCYQTYSRSSKAPDCLLKLAMSLDRLGQRDAACSSYGELAVKFPNAPGAVRNRADNERRRLGCP